MKNTTITKTAEKKLSGECCPNFNPEKWEEKTYVWRDKKFIKASLATFFHIPFPPVIGKKITRMMKMAKDTNSLLENQEDILLLFTDPSAFKSEIYLSVTQEVPGAENATLSGRYLSKVFDAKNFEIPKLIKQMNTYLEEEGEKAENYYVHYAYCPKCAREAGHNYMVLFAKLEG